jgi:hypothetical protein
MWPWPAEWAPGKTGSTAERGFWVPITEDKNHLPKADKRTAGRQASVLPVNGGGDDRFQNLYGYFGAADEKVPLLMVCVKRKPLHLVFYLRLGESSFIIPEFACGEMREGASRAGLEALGGPQDGSLGSYLGRSFKGGSATLRGYARGVGGTRRRTCAVSVDGCGRCGEWRQN